MTSVVTVKKEVEKLKQQTQVKPNPGVIITCWCIDRGDGESGFARFNTNTPDKKTPLSDEELKRLKAKWRENDEV